ncbi:MAG: CDP-diacylglycerol--glycerol-3-phosphate 3-phosphatidyltransferase [Verrucomicrobiales bacterium]|nr:CDP-diacylglycerol--glycerol-3-phosphate 3-phosphatidyltransferase [Verrucomicrobiales bacterium]|tara:strand:+ start:200 stop:790 length:591 start_codon:yes stop_codon:yes gene_type:complete
MNLPNQLTMGRLFLTALFVAVMSIPDQLLKSFHLLDYRITIAILFFLIASLTDFLDGYIARKLKLVTDFGKLIDPLVDKILTSAVFIILTQENMIPAWITITIISREFLVTGLRLLASNQGKVLSADSLGKWKTTSQIIVASFFLIVMGSNEPTLNCLEFIDQPMIGNLLIIICTTITIVSGWSYLSKNRQLVKTS